MCNDIPPASKPAEPAAVTMPRMLHFDTTSGPLPAPFKIAHRNRPLAAESAWPLENPFGVWSRSAATGG